MKELIKSYAARLEPQLYAAVGEKDGLTKTIYEAAGYSLKAGGKRLRPVLMLMFAELLGLAEQEVMPFACALEMIHTYSLIHDDLPAMDNDDLRRGKPTNHRVFGEAMAILAGDALLNLAAETVSAARYSIPAGRVLAAVHELFSASGTKGMIGGQVIDIESEGRAVSLETLQKLQLLKTGALIRAAGRVPAVLAAADEQQLEAITQYCENLGMAFQIRDDLLDVYGSTEELGKKTGSDEANQKTTYVSLCGMEKSEQLVEEYTGKAVASLDIFGDKAAQLKELAVYLTNRRS